MQTAAQTAARAISKTLTDRYLLHANTTYFESRGLKVRLMKTAALKRFVHADGAAAKGGKGKEFARKAGRVAQNAALRLPIPLVAQAVDFFADPVPTVDHNSPFDITARRVASLAPHINQSLSFSVPPATVPSSLLDKSSALAIKLDTWQTKRHETNADRQRHLLAVAEGREAPRRGTWWQTIQEMRAGVGRGSNVRKLKVEVKKADRLEANRTEGLVWLVLMDIEMGTFFSFTCT